jgi:hypothetical protein
MGGTPPALDITLARGTQREERTRDQLLRIIAKHDVSRWVRTTTLRIEEGAIPFSHPVLRLNTRHLSDDHALLSTFLHEQIHWLLTERRGACREALKDLRPRYLEIPVGHPEGARDRESSYLHLVVNYLELVALEEMIGAEAARTVFDFWLTDHYTGIYRIVLNDREAIAEIVERHRLLP